MYRRLRPFSYNRGILSAPPFAPTIKSVELWEYPGIMNRREFLQSSASGVLLTGTGVGTTDNPNRIAPTSWYDRPMPWAPVAFVEDDPHKYDPKFWLDYFQRLHVDAACLSAGGCVAFYPTRIPLH